MSTTQEATINPDGTTNVPPTNSENNETYTDENNSTFTQEEEEIPDVTTKTIDPAIYLGILVIIIGLISLFLYKRRKKKF